MSQLEAHRPWKQGEEIVHARIWKTRGNVPTTYPGGKGQKFANSILLKLRRGDWIKTKGKGEDGGEIVGQEIKIICDKNKTAPPKRSGVVRFFFEDCGELKAGQYDNVTEVALYAVHYGLIAQAGAFYAVEGVEKKIQGQDKLTAFLRSQPELVDKLRSQIIKLAIH